MASVDGLEGLSIGHLAAALGVSKSGLFAHFGSKEELQLATIEAASEIFDEEVVMSALVETTGIGRLRALAENFLRHVEARVFPGGCFFASVAAEMDTHPGPVRDRAIQMTDAWFTGLLAAVRDAQAEGAVDPAEDPAQLAFELNAYLLMANAAFVAMDSTVPLAAARRAIDRRLS